MFRNNAIVVGGIVIALMYTHLSAQSVNARAQSESRPRCKCNVLPWTPDPPCVRTCSEMILDGATASELMTKLKLSTTSERAIADLKKDGVTQNEVGAFLQTDSGKEFLRAVERAPARDFKLLVDDAQLKSNNRFDSVVEKPQR